MRCIIRLDDITPDMNWENFNLIRDILDKNEIYPLIGVVPNNRDCSLHKEDAKVDFFRVVRELQKKGWIVAQHGTSHRYCTQNSGLLRINPFSEFAGRAFEEQLICIQQGKQILEENNILTDVFMAPGHTFDNNTIKALKKAGFHVITDGLYKRPYYYKDMLFVPCKMVGNYRIKGLDTICLHPNVMEEEDIKQLKWFCQNNKDSIISFHPERLKEEAVNRNFYVALYERCFVLKRNLKNKVTHSERLAWYMSYTNHKSSKIKWLKRVFFLPLLLTSQYRNH